MTWVTIHDGGKIHRYAVARTRDGVWVGWSGGSAYFPADRKSSSFAAAHGPAHDEIHAPMTGKVVAVKVHPGDPIEVGGLLVVLEAMKMEYKLLAPRTGTVEEVNCREGDLVDLGMTLVTLTE
jgi:acetyl/propionyl-CoA carboxylase alpha subunit